MKAVPPREDSLVLEVIGVAVREPTNSGSVVAFRYLGFRTWRPWSLHDRREESASFWMSLALLVVLIALLWLASSSTIPTGWPAVVAVATLALWWAVVLLVPVEIRRTFKIPMIVGACGSSVPRPSSPSSSSA